MEHYINPFVDYGFKKLFGTEENKDLLISFLNALIGGEDPIKDLTYKNVERLGDLVGTRTNYFDVYCTTSTGEEFIVEMQNTWQPFFKDRTIYYAAKPIHYELKNVYVVAMMNFKLPDKEYAEDSFLHKIQLMDVEDFHVFYEKLTLYYVELPKIDCVKLDLDTPLGRWFHALNSLYYYDRKPKNLNDAVFDKLFRQAELAAMTPDEGLAYERSMKVYLDTFNQIEGGRILGHREGLAEGERRGLAKGKALGLAEGKELGLAEGKELGLAEGKELGIVEGAKKAKLEMAERMLSKGMSKEVVAELAGVSVEEVGGSS